MYRLATLVVGLALVSNSAGIRTAGKRTYGGVTHVAIVAASTTHDTPSHNVLVPPYDDAQLASERLR